MDAERIAEMFAGFGAVDIRCMFGGQGLFADGLMFGLISDGVVYLKADDTAAFEREGQTPFSYAAKGGRRVIMSYWRLPERLYDDSDELADWARAAVAAAQRSQVRPKRTGVRGKVRRPGSGTP